MTMTCEKGHAMFVRDRFKFDHEPGDTPRNTEMLNLFSSMGLQLGAEVTLWYCQECDYAQAEFDYEDPPRILGGET